MGQPASRAQPPSCTSKNSQIQRLSDKLLPGVASKNPPRNRGQLKRLPDALLLEASGLAEALGISGMCQQKPSRNKGRAHVQAFGCHNNPHRSKGCQTRCCWEVSRLVEVPRISRDVPAKTLTEQGAAAHISNLLDVVTALTDRRTARHVTAERCRGSWRCQEYIQGCASKSPHGTSTCRAHVQEIHRSRTCPSFWML